MTWYPGWDSLESVKFWHIFWEVAGIVILALLVGAEILAFQYSHRKDYLIDAAERSRVEEQQRQQSAAEERRTAEVDNLQRQLSEADKKVAELNRLRVPRHLSDAEKASLTARLAGQPVGQLAIKASAAADDANAYAGELAALFQGIGWQVRIDNAIMFGPDISGIWLTIKDPSAVLPATVALQHAFENAGFPIRNVVTTDPGVPTVNEIWLSIGAKK